MSLEEIKRDPAIKSMFEEAGVENPSAGFTENIIKNIEAQSAQSVFVYKPIISNRIWKILAFLFSSLILFIIFASPSGGAGQSVQLFKNVIKIDFTTITDIVQKMSISLDLSPIFKISLLALMVFSFINLLIIHNQSRSYFKKNF